MYIILKPNLLVIESKAPMESVRSAQLLELSVAEAAPAFVAAGLITNEELEQTLNEMRRLAADETVLALMPRVSQVWARKPAPQVSKAA